MVAVRSWGTEELKPSLLSFIPSQVPSPGMWGGVRAGRTGKHGVKPAPRDVPALSTVADSVGYTISR